MARDKIDFKFPKAAILWRLHKVIAQYEHINFNLHTLGRELNIPGPLIKLSVEELVNDSYCETTTEPEWHQHPFTDDHIETNETYVEITKYGVLEVEQWDDEYHDSLVRRIGGQMNLSKSQNTQSNEEIWEPIPIDRSSQEYNHVIETLDEAIEKIEMDNGYAANLPEERHSIVWALKEGLRSIKELAPSLSQIRVMVLAPLNKAIERFKDAVPGVAAMLAREAVKEWIKSMFRGSS